MLYWKFFGAFDAVRLKTSIQGMQMHPLADADPQKILGQRTDSRSVAHEKLKMQTISYPIPLMFNFMFW